MNKDRKEKIRKVKIWLVKKQYEYLEKYGRLPTERDLYG